MDDFDAMEAITLIAGEYQGELLNAAVAVEEVRKVLAMIKEKVDG